ncbi:hypothetical protein F5X99DRAFT_373258, partial [Biscogniauxia marginata]
MTCFTCSVTIYVVYILLVLYFPRKKCYIRTKTRKEKTKKKRSFPFLAIPPHFLARLVGLHFQSSPVPTQSYFVFLCLAVCRCRVSGPPRNSPDDPDVITPVMISLPGQSLLLFVFSAPP